MELSDLIELPGGMTELPDDFARAGDIPPAIMDQINYYVKGEGKMHNTLPDTVAAAQDLLHEAGDKIAGDRQDDYGDPLKNFTRIATLWEAYLGTEVTAADVASLFMLAKLSRLANTIDHEDSWVDLCGYAALGGALANE